MDNKLNWNLKELFEDEISLDNAIKEFYELLGKIKTFKGRLGNSADEMYEYFKVLEKTLELHERIYAYAMFKYHQDMSSVEAIKLYKRVEKISNTIN